MDPGVALPGLKLKILTVCKTGLTRVLAPVLPRTHFIDLLMAMAKPGLFQLFSIIMIAMDGQSGTREFLRTHMQD